MNIYNGDTHAWCGYEHVILHIIYFISTSYKNGVVDDGVPAILQYGPSDLYLADRKETMAILKKDTHTPLHICKLGPLIMLIFCGTHGHLASTTYNI